MLSFDFIRFLYYAITFPVKPEGFAEPSTS